MDPVSSELYSFQKEQNSTTKSYSSNLEAAAGTTKNDKLRIDRLHQGYMYIAMEE